MKSPGELDKLIKRRIALARKAISNQCMVMNHFCIRITNMEETQNLLTESFGVCNFTNLNVGNGKVYPGEERLSKTWIADGIALELMEPSDKSKLTFSTGEGLPVGYLSEIGFFTPDLEAELIRLEKLGWHVNGRCETPGARMAKIDTIPPSGVPVELTQVLDLEMYSM